MGTKKTFTRKTTQSMHADKSQWIKRFPLFRRLSEIIWWVSMIQCLNHELLCSAKPCYDMIPRSCFDICTQAFRHSCHNDSFFGFSSDLICHRIHLKRVNGSRWQYYCYIYCGMLYYFRNCANGHAYLSKSTLQLNKHLVSAVFPFSY